MLLSMCTAASLLLLRPCTALTVRGRATAEFFPEISCDDVLNLEEGVVQAHCLVVLLDGSTVAHAIRARYVLQQLGLLTAADISEGSLLPPVVAGR